MTKPRLAGSAASAGCSRSPTRPGSASSSGPGGGPAASSVDRTCSTNRSRPPRLAGPAGSRGPPAAGRPLRTTRGWTRRCRRSSSSNGRSSAGARRTVTGPPGLRGGALEAAQHRGSGSVSVSERTARRSSGRGCARCRPRSRGRRRPPRRAASARISPSPAVLGAGHHPVVRQCEELASESHGRLASVSVVVVTRTIGRHRRVALMGQLPHLSGRPARAQADGGREEAVLDREQARRHTAGGAGLHVDVLDVVAGRLRRDHQLGRDLLARQPAGHQPQHVDLPGGEPGRPLAAASVARCPAATSTASTASPSRRPARTSARSSTAAWSLGRAGRSMRPRLHHRLVHVGRGQDRAGSGIAAAGQPARVAGPVQALAELGGQRHRSVAARATAPASARSGTAGGAPAPIRRRRAGRACPRWRSTRRAGRDRGPARPPQRCQRPAVETELRRRRRRPAAATPRAWPSVYGDLRSTKSAMAPSASSSSSSPTGDPTRIGLGGDHVVPRARRRRARRGCRRPPRRTAPRCRGRTGCRPSLRARSTAAVTPPDRCATSTNSASCDTRPRSAPLARRARRAIPCRPTARRTRRPPPARRPAARSRPPATGHRRMAGDHPVDLPVARQREVQGRRGIAAAAAAPSPSRRIPATADRTPCTP